MKSIGITPYEARAEFAALVAQAELPLDRAALLLAAEDDPPIDVDHYLAQLDRLAASARARERQERDARARLIGLSEFLFDESGFDGNAGDYYDARNSFLNEVIDRRIGIPITLSVLYLEVARRIGLSLDGVGMPGHFLVRYEDREGEIFIDPFHGGRWLDEAGCRALLGEVYGGSVAFSRDYLRAVTKHQILIRMLANLKGIYARAGDYHRMLGAIERALLIDPDLATEIRDRGLALYGLGRWERAREDLEDYLRRRPEAGDGAAIRARLGEIRREQARLN